MTRASLNEKAPVAAATADEGQSRNRDNTKPNEKVGPDMSTLATDASGVEASVETTYPKPINMVREGVQEVWWEHRPGVIAPVRDVVPDGYIEDGVVLKRLKAIDRAADIRTLHHLAKAAVAAGLPGRESGRYRRIEDDGSCVMAGVYASYPERTVEAILALAKARLGLSLPRDLRHLITEDDKAHMFPEAQSVVERQLLRWEDTEDQALALISDYRSPGADVEPPRGERPTWLTNDEDLQWEWVERINGGPGWCRTLIGEYVTDYGVIEVVRTEEVLDDGTIEILDDGAVVDLGSLCFDEPFPIEEAPYVLRRLAAQLLGVADKIEEDN